MRQLVSFLFLEAKGVCIIKSAFLLKLWFEKNQTIQEELRKGLKCYKGEIQRALFISHIQKQIRADLGTLTVRYDTQYESILGSKKSDIQWAIRNIFNSSKKITKHFIRFFYLHISRNNFLK